MLNESAFKDVMYGLIDTCEWEDEIIRSIDRMGFIKSCYSIDSMSIPAYRALKDILASSYHRETLDIINWWLGNYLSDEPSIIKDENDNKLFEIETISDLYNYITDLEEEQSE